jgi:hypothetical protein
MSRQVRILLLILVILVIVVLVAENPFKGRAESKVRQGKTLFPAFAADKITQVTVFGKRDTVTLSRDDDQWLLLDGEDSYPADTSGVHKMLTAVPELTDRVVVSRNPEKQSVYQVDSTGVRVVMTGAPDDTIAQFVIGKAGPSFSSSYLRVSGSDAVLLQDEQLANVFDRVVEAWKDRYLIRADRESVSSISVEGPETSYRLEKNAQGTWELVEPEVGPAKDNEANRLVATVTRFLADQIVAPSDTVQTGLDQPDWTIGVTMQDGSEYVVLVGDMAEQERRYAKLEGGRWTYLLGKHRLDAFQKQPDELLAPPPPEPEPVPVDTLPPDTLPKESPGAPEPLTE